MGTNYLVMDINIVYSMVNMKLRDFYSSLDDFCEGEDVEKDAILARFNDNGYIYNEETNQFICK
ncbi:DUF4250 domain-containing protein [uncultured Fusobacterium sp.]|uniref:DUF4250 domain-containing protein n=1 Tax=uncultured Fusobacterium sp. TaxID=159267 RepID=UPI0015A528D8|nr:DUF4250 domain-containing protein [uncultured Fusobacterium sp.]